MKLIIASLLLLIPSLRATPVSDPEIVVKLTSDLLPLKLAVASDEPLKSDEYTAAELQSLATYSQNQAMNRFEDDLLDFQLQHYPTLSTLAQSGARLKPFIGPDQAYKLATVLTGKNLPEADVKRLVEALVGILNSAEVCRETHTSLRDSSEFRGAAEKARDALKVLRVTNTDLRIVMDSLFRGAVAASSQPSRIKFQ